MVLAKNLIDYLDAPGSLDSATVADIMDPAYYVPQSMAVWNVLEEMRRRRIHMAIVVDEYGGTAGTFHFVRRKTCFDDACRPKRRQPTLCIRVTSNRSWQES